MAIEYTPEQIEFQKPNPTCYGYMAGLAERTGVRQDLLRLTLSLFLGYPIALLHRNIVQYMTPKSQHIFFAACGFLICVFNFGFDAYHSLNAIWVTYILTRTFRQDPAIYISASFVYHMGYLLFGYVFVKKDLEITWTMPHCVLVLRMIGFCFDIVDGQRPLTQLSNYQKDTALAEVPTLLELAAYAYFPASFLVGPQFPFTRYRRFVNGVFRNRTGFVQAGLLRGATGILYMAMRHFGAQVISDQYILSDSFCHQNMVRKLVDIGLWGKLALYKYIGCWLVVEGSLTCMGFTYAGKNADGEDDWTGCSNVHLMLFETGIIMTHYVQSFNINTNNWVAQYIYKRLKFLKNRRISYMASLAFVAIWHGIYSGYYVTFALEFFVVNIERQIQGIYSKRILPRYGKALEASQPYKVMMFTLLKVYNIVYMGWAMTPFVLLTAEKWMRVFKALNYFGFVMIAVWFAIFNLFKLCGVLKGSVKQK